MTFGLRSIGTHGPVPCPPPNLSVIGFFLLAFFKDKIYQKNYNTLHKLWQGIAESLC